MTRKKDPKSPLVQTTRAESRKLQNSHGKQTEEAGRCCQALEALGTPEAMRLLHRLTKQKAETARVVEASQVVLDELGEARDRYYEANRDLGAVVKGVVAATRQAEPEVFAGLPPLDGEASLTAGPLAHALRDQGQARLAELVEAVRVKRLNDLRAYEAAVERQGAVQPGRSAQAALGQLLLEAAGLIHASVPLGSPILDILNPPRAKKEAGKKEAGKKEAGKKEAGKKEDQPRPGPDGAANEAPGEVPAPKVAG